MPSHARSTAPVSVIVPAYNCAPYIGAALDSALSQEPAPLEIIVADDGSTDDTASVVRGFGLPVRYHRLPGTRNGAAAARNAAMRLSRGEFLAFLDADDVWLPRKLDAQLDVLRTYTDISLCATNFGLWRRRADGTWPAPEMALEPVFGSNPIPPTAIDASRTGWLYGQLLMETIVWTSTVVMRRNLYERLGGFREDLRLGQDYEYWLRASRVTKFVTLARPFALYRKHPESATAAWAPVNYELLALRSALARWGRQSPDGSYVSRTDIRRRIGTLHFNMAYNQLWSSSPHRAFRPACKAAFHRPTFSRTWAYIALSILRPLAVAAGYSKPNTKKTG